MRSVQTRIRNFRNAMRRSKNLNQRRQYGLNIRNLAKFYRQLRGLLARFKKNPKTRTTTKRTKSYSFKSYAQVLHRMKIVRSNKGKTLKLYRKSKGARKRIYLRRYRAYSRFYAQLRRLSIRFRRIERRNAKRQKASRKVSTKSFTFNNIKQVNQRISIFNRKIRSYNRWRKMKGS